MTIVGGSEPIGMQTAPSLGDDRRCTLPRPIAAAVRATSRATGASAATGAAFIARRSRGVTASRASPVLARRARSGGVSTSGASRSSSAGSKARSGAGPEQLDGPALERREHRRAHPGGVRTPAQVEDGGEDLERGRRQPPRGQRPPRVGPGAIEQDVEGGRLVVARVELGERAQQSHVLRELAPRALEGLLGLAGCRARSARG